MAGGARRVAVDAPLEARRASFKPKAPRATSGALAKYARLVSSASDGAVTGFDPEGARA
jgi:dihydroxy-acid dehydratase